MPEEEYIKKKHKQKLIKMSELRFAKCSFMFAGAPNIHFNGMCPLSTARKYTEKQTHSQNVLYIHGIGGLAPQFIKIVPLYGIPQGQLYNLYQFASICARRIIPVCQTPRDVQTPPRSHQVSRQSKLWRPNSTPAFVCSPPIPLADCEN